MPSSLPRAAKALFSNLAHTIRRLFSSLPRVTRALLIANASVYVLQLVSGNALVVFELWPLGSRGGAYGAPGFMPWQLLTYGFMHDNPAHLVFNMLALVMFGAPLEHKWGNRRFLAYYLVCVIGAALCQLAAGAWTMAQGGEAYPTLGASGGIYGLLLAYGVLFPNQRVAALPFPFFIKARTLVVIYGVAELLIGLNGWQPGVAHFAHLGGMLFGWLLIRYWNGQPPFGRRRPPRLRVIR